MSLTPRRALAEIKTAGDKKTRRTRIRNLTEVKANHLVAKQDELEAAGAMLPKEVLEIAAVDPQPATERPRRRRQPPSQAQPSTTAQSQPVEGPSTRTRTAKTTTKASAAKPKATTQKGTKRTGTKVSKALSSSQPTATEEFHSCVDPDSRPPSCTESAPSSPKERVDSTPAPVQDLFATDGLFATSRAPEAPPIHPAAKGPTNTALLEGVITEQSTMEHEELPLDAQDSAPPFLWPGFGDPPPPTPPPVESRVIDSLVQLPVSPAEQKSRSPCFGYVSPSAPFTSDSSPADAQKTSAEPSSSGPEEGMPSPACPPPPQPPSNVPRPTATKVRLIFESRAAVPIESYKPPELLRPSAPKPPQRRGSEALPPYIPPAYLMSLEPMSPSRYPMKCCDLGEPGNGDSSPGDVVDLLASPEPEREYEEESSEGDSPIRLVPMDEQARVRQRAAELAATRNAAGGASASRYNPFVTDFASCLRTPTRGGGQQTPVKTVPALTPSRQPVSFGALTPPRRMHGDYLEDNDENEPFSGKRDVRNMTGTTKTLTPTAKTVPPPSVTPTRRRQMVKPTCKDLFPDPPETELRPRERQRKAEYYYNLFNREVFDDKLPHYLPLVWNARLRKTAGQAVFARSGNASKESRSHDPDDDEEELITMVQNLTLNADGKSGQSAMVPKRIELAPKILVTEERLAATLLHECCHIAQRTLEVAIDPPHGPIFKRWAAKASRRFPQYKVSTRHDYEIHQPHQWKCLKCGLIYKRFSRSINVDKHRCGTQNCGGCLVYLGEFLTSGILKPPNMRQLTPYNDFVRAMYDKAVATAEDPRDVMTIIGRWWRERQREEEDGESVL